MADKLTFEQIATEWMISCWYQWGDENRQSHFTVKSTTINGAMQKALKDLKFMDIETKDIQRISITENESHFLPNE